MDQKNFHLNTSFAFPFIIVLLLFAAWVGAYQFSVHAAHGEPRKIAHSQPLPPFQLETADHALFTNKNLQQHWTFLLLGYTRCKDICPLSLSFLNRIYNTLIGEYPTLQVVFVSIDPQYDNSQRLRRYITGFNKNFLGVTGELQQLNILQRNLGASTDGPVLHSKMIFLVNPDAQVYAKFANTTNMDVAIRMFENAVARGQPPAA